MSEIFLILFFTSVSSKNYGVKFRNHFMVVCFTNLIYQTLNLEYQSRLSLLNKKTKFCPSIWPRTVCVGKYLSPGANMLWTELEFFIQELNL